MGKSMGVRPTQLTENLKNRLAKLFRILTREMCRSDTHGLSAKALLQIASRNPSSLLDALHA